MSVAWYLRNLHSSTPCTVPTVKRTCVAAGVCACARARMDCRARANKKTTSANDDVQAVALCRWLVRLPMGAERQQLITIGCSVEILTLNRPAALNAINSTMLHELASYFGGLVDADKGLAKPAQPAPRVVIIRGEGRGFCGGLDLADTGGFADQDVNKSMSSQVCVVDGARSLTHAPHAEKPVAALRAHCAHAQVPATSDCRSSRRDVRWRSRAGAGC